MMVLEFEAAGRASEGRRVRDARFIQRSELPVSAACLVATGVRETLASLFGTAVELTLFRPVVPSAQAWRAISSDATIYRLHGARGDAAIVLRAPDALALAVAAFGEEPGDERALSAIERRVLDRIADALSAAVAPICGGSPTRSLAGGEAPASFITFFELQLERPVRARVGIALARDPEQPIVPGLRIEDLLDLELDLCVRIEAPSMRAGELLALEPGTIVPMTESTSLTGTLLLAGRAIAGGECGVRGTRFALAIGPSREGSTGTAS